jgi:collagenase-like PrtC family protease
VRPAEIPLPGGRLIWSPEVDLSGIVGLLLKAGIVSFKIEGRTRTTEYVTLSTRKMRDAVDRAVGDADLTDLELNRFFYLEHHARLRAEG